MPPGWGSSPEMPPAQPPPQPRGGVCQPGGDPAGVRGDDSSRVDPYNCPPRHSGQGLDVLLAPRAAPWQAPIGTGRAPAWASGHETSRTFISNPSASRTHTTVCPTNLESLWLCRPPPSLSPGWGHSRDWGHHSGPSLVLWADRGDTSPPGHPLCQTDARTWPQNRMPAPSPKDLTPSPNPSPNHFQCAEIPVSSDRRHEAAKQTGAEPLLGQLRS